jgi:hypothetical protein
MTVFFVAHAPEEQVSRLVSGGIHSGMTCVSPELHVVGAIEYLVVDVSQLNSWRIPVR